MSRHLEILRKAKRDRELLAREAYPGDDNGTRHVKNHAGVSWRYGSNGRGQWQQLANELFLGREAPQAVGLVSTTAGEGTSYVASRLAIEVARSSEEACLLLEANLYRPSQAEEHGVEPDPGLRRILLDKEFPIDQCLRQTAVEPLWLIPGGSAVNGSAGAPDWSQFPRVFQALRDRFSVVVVDLPPVNLSTDAMLVGALLDGVVLIVEADLCSREVIQNAVSRLRRANPNVIGTILNKRKFVIPEPIYRRL